jgi:exosome complex component RRP4
MLNVNVLRADAPPDVRRSATNTMVVTPGESITAHQGFLRGHGSYIEGDELVASVAGEILRVNKLVSVRPLQSRYVGEIGDVLVGRIVEVGAKRWKVDVGGVQDAVLMLSSVILPGGVQRRRTYEDQLQMRELFVEGDLLSVRRTNLTHTHCHALFARGPRFVLPRGRRPRHVAIYGRQIALCFAAHTLAQMGHERRSMTRMHGHFNSSKWHM